MKLTLTKKKARVLIFDIENRPLSYWYDGNPTAEVTVISYKWLKNHSTSVLLAKGVGNRDILEKFRPIYDSADILVGHNIRTHDLPILNAAYIENGMEPLGPKLTVDTLRDLLRWKDIPRSLEYLCDLLGCPFTKKHMSQDDWRRANRLDPEGLKLAKERCSVDVRATEWVYEELRDRGLLTKQARVWKP